MLVFNQRLERIQNPRLPIDILASSSKGNAVYIQPQRILFDLGIPFKHLSVELLLNTDYIFLTHEHGDHLNLPALRRVLRVYPNIQAVVSEPLYNILINQLQPTTIKQIQPLSYETPAALRTRDQMNIEVTLYPTKHGDITNTAYYLQDERFNTALLYATDLEDIDDLPQDQPINLMLLEANYDTRELMTYLDDLDSQEQHPWFESNQEMQQALNQKRHRALSNLRHLSEEQALTYVKHHLSLHGYFIPLHGSRTFGNYIQPNTIL